MDNVPWFSLLTMVTLSATLSIMADAQDCFGGIETFEKMVSMSFTGAVAYKSMLQQPGQAITRDCINLCKQQASCLSFALNYSSSSCISYNVNSIGRGEEVIPAHSVNFYEKICFRGVSKHTFDSACRDRLWVFDRVRDAYLEGHVDKEAKNVRTKEDCEKLCITEERFKCRSADYDEIQHVCRMSRETRRTKPNAFRVVPGSFRNYLENQCAPPPPASCRYEARSDVTVLTPDYLQFAASATDCMDQCDAETAFNCWAYSYVDNRCQLSSDSGVTWGKGIRLPTQTGAVFGELKCFFEQCDNGVMTFEKMTGVLLRSAQGTMMGVNKPGSLGNTLECAQICIDDGTECPAFSDHYHNMRCDRLDRNSNGRTQELIPRDGESYFEKICLQGPEAQTCSDKAWAFERALGYELAEGLYQKTINKAETRTTCIQLCLSEREFTCRSARYNEDTGECKLSPADRRTDPMKYYRSEDARVSYLENSCLPVETTCPYVETEDAYPTYSNLIQTEGISTLESCRELCTDYLKFTCRSFSYYSSALQCFLSGDDKSSGGSAAIQRRPGIMYYERMCPQASTSEATTESQTHSPSEVSTVTSSAYLPTLGISSNTQAQFQEKETTVKTRPPYQPQEPSRPECSPTERLIFEKLTGFEPFGVTSTLLYRGDSSTPGITAECVRRCQALSDCRSFVLDHQRYECSSVQDPPSVHPADFRASIGKTYFGGLCVPAYLGCSKLWVYERIMDNELQGLAALDVVRVVSLEQCQLHCLETRKYVCRAANYFHLRRECHIFGEGRDAVKAHLVGSSRVDYFENQCLLETSYCPYQKSEPDIAMVYVTKSLADTPSTLHCERECNREREFNCRSYSFWNNGVPDSGICMLGAESRLTGHAVGLQYRQGAIYAGKICKAEDTDGRVDPTPSSSPAQQTTVTAKIHTTQTLPPKIIEHPPFPPPSEKHLPPPKKSYPPPSKEYLPPSKEYPPPLPPPMRPMAPPICSPSQYAYEKVVGHEVRGGRRERVPSRMPMGVVHSCKAECQRLGDTCQGFVVQYKSYQNCYVILRSMDEEPILIPSFDSVYFKKVCLRERPCQKVWAFERIIHHELHTEPIRESSEVLERTDCEDLCLQERPLCKSAVYHYHTRVCQMFTDTKRSAPDHFHYTNEEVEYLENQCVADSPTCQYRDFPDRFLPQIDRLTRSFNLADCQRQCDTEQDFTCRSVNFETVARDCALSSEDVSSVPQGINALQPRRNSLYSEKGNCEQVSVQCNQQDMLLTIHFDSPFHGRVYAKGNPAQCYVVGTGQSSLQFAIAMGPRCGTKPEPNDRYVNEVVIQQHPVIMTDHDKTIKVVCSFETQERTYTMAGPGVGPSGMDVGRTYNNVQPITAVVTNTAPPPNVAMRVLDHTGRDARSVGLGEELTLKIELREQSSAFAIFARNLYARSSNGESLFLIDSTGCPTDASIFPALLLDPTDHKSLLSTFKAFRFPSSGMVNFEVQIRFCQEKCEEIRCGGKGPSFGRRKRDLEDSYVYLNASNESLQDDDDVYFDHETYDTLQAIVQEEAKHIVVPDYKNSRSSDSNLNTDEIDEDIKEIFPSSTTIAASLPSTVYGTFKESVQNDFETTVKESMKDSTEISNESSTHKPSETNLTESNSTFTERESKSYSESLSGTSAMMMDDTAPVLKEHLMSESYQNENMFEHEDKTSDGYISEMDSKHTGVTFNDKIIENKTEAHSVDFGTEMNRLDKTTANDTPHSNTEIKFESTTQKYPTLPINFTEESLKVTHGTTEMEQTSSFNRKFAFIHSEETNGTTPISTYAFMSVRNPTLLSNETEVNDDSRKDSFLRPDAGGFGSSQPNHRPYVLSKGNWPNVPRTDPFSAGRNPYSQPNIMQGTQENTHKINHDRMQPLPLVPQRLVDNPHRNWNPGAINNAHHSGYPPYQSHPVEIHELPSSWTNNKDFSPHQTPSEHYNGYNSQDNNGRGQIPTTSPPNRTPDLKIDTMNRYGARQQPNPMIQIQRPLEILDHPNQRHQVYRPSNNAQSNPVEISNNFDSNSQQHNDPYSHSRRYDYNRSRYQPRPIELPNQPNVPPHWGGAPNRMNNQQPNPNVHGNVDPTINKWPNNPIPPINTRAPSRGQNRPEDKQHPASQLYPQGPQHPSIQEEKWRDSFNRQNGQNSDPGRNSFYAQQPQYRPSEVVATTQKSVPEEVPLSLAILVGEDGKSQNSASHPNGNGKSKYPWRPPTQYNRGLQRHNIINTPRPEPIDEDKVCTSKATVIATAVSVTLVYLGVVAGAIVGYRWYRKNKRRKVMAAAAHPVHFPPNPTNANVTYSTPDVTFRNVYGNFPVSSTSTT